jgi:class 3 adenylate cyclase
VYGRSAARSSTRVAAPSSGDETSAHVVGHRLRQERPVQSALERFRGREVDSAGDGFLAAFDGPARAIRCGLAISEATRDIGIDVRVGIHTGEIELAGDDIRGIAVHIGSWIAALGGPGDVLVGISLADLGTHSLKGAPGRWQIFAAAA